MEPKRLLNRPARSWSGSKPGGCLALVGLIFLSGGVFMSLATAGILPAKVKGQRPPDAVLYCMAAMFLIPGLWMGVSGVRGWLFRKEHAWDRRGSSPGRAREVAFALGLAVFLTLFMVPFNWALLRKVDPMPWGFWLLIGPFDLAALAVWKRGIHRTLQVLRHPPGRLEFVRFPYRSGEAVELRFVPPQGLREPFTATLRCVEEREERSGKNRQVLSYALYEASVTARPTGKVALRFEVPPEAPGTDLEADLPRYWELEVALERPGLDYCERFPVPVFSRG